MIPLGRIPCTAIRDQLFAFLRLCHELRYDAKRDLRGILRLDSSSSASASFLMRPSYFDLEIKTNGSVFKHKD